MEGSQERPESKESVMASLQMQIGTIEKAIGDVHDQARAMENHGTNPELVDSFRSSVE